MDRQQNVTDQTANKKVITDRQHMSAS